MSLLRSSKFIKYFISFNRNFAVNRTSEANRLVLKEVSLLTPQVRCLRQVIAAKSNIENQVEKLDQDVRRTGRVSRKDLEEVLKELKKSRKATGTQSLMIIRCCGSLLPDETPEARTELLQNVLQTLEEIGAPIDISHYNALLRAYIENEYTFSPTEFLSILQKKGIEPNRVTFQRLISVYCQTGDIEGATRILEFMKEKQMPVNENVFKSLIHGHFQAGDTQSALGILNVMKQANINPSADTYTVIMCGHAKNGDINAINEVLSQCEADVDIHDKDLLEVIQSLAINDHTDLIDQLLPKLKKTPGYNQDAKNAVLRLVLNGKDEAAFKILRSMITVTTSDGDPLPVGNFLIKQLVKCNRPLEKILSLCADLKNSGENENALLVATEASLLNENPERSLKLLSALSKEHEVCQHYYWPIFVQYGKSGNMEGLRSALMQMLLEVGEPASAETLRDMIIPYIPSGEVGILELRKAGVPVPTAAASMIGYLLGNNELKYAAKIGLQFKANYGSVYIRKQAVSAFLRTKDVNSFVILIRLILDSIKDEENAADKILLDAASAVRREGRLNEQINGLLQGFLDFGIGITSETAKQLENMLDAKHLTPEISNLLSQLTSPNLSVCELERPEVSTRRPIQTADVDEGTLLKSLEIAASKGDPAFGIKRQLLGYYCVNKDLEKAEKLYKDLEASGFEFVTGTLVLLMELYINLENLPKAIEVYENIYEKSSDANPIQLGPAKILKLGGLMIQEDKLEDALELFTKHRLDGEVPKGYNTQSAAWRILTNLADKKDPEMVKRVFDKLAECKFIEGNNITLGPLIKVHLLRDDVDSALATFEDCCHKYRATPWKNEIACKLIEKEDPISLQKLTDLSTDIHGEINSLYDLVLSFIECGRIRQARKILETPGLRLRNQRISSACERYTMEGKVKYLENLVEATKDFNHIDRSDIYYHLLLSYCKTDDVDKAFGLWTQMQDEDVQPSDAFLVNLGMLLQKHNRPIPFTIPDIEVTEQEDEKNLNPSSSQIKVFRKVMNSKNVEGALEMLSSFNLSDLSNGDRTKLLSLLLNNGRIGEASKLLIDWLTKGFRPNYKTISFVINSLAKMGDIDTLTSVENVLDKDLRRYTSLSNRRAHCMVEAGRVDELLSKLEEDIKSAKTVEDVDNLREEFPRGGIFSVLSSAPASLPKVEEIAQLYRQKGIFEPSNALWAYYFANGNFEKALEYWSVLNKNERIMFQPILKQIRFTKDVALCWDLLNLFKSNNVEKKNLGPIYSLLMEIELMSENLPECERILEEALKDCTIEILSRNVLLKLKKYMEISGKTFKYTLPSRKPRQVREESSTSSDSDSDSETAQKPRVRV